MEYKLRGIYQMNEKIADPKSDVLKRLKRIEGQVKGIQRMVEEEKDCIEIMTQVAAVRAAINKAAVVIMECHSKKCIQNAISSEDKDAAMAELTKTINRFMKFSE
jgi:DNA-binding FrmR family transcriptional regulator